MADKKEVYKRIKIAGMFSFIPLLLASGVIMGYICGDFLEKKFPSFSFAVPLCIGIGIAASFMESIRIVKLALKIERGE